MDANIKLSKDEEKDIGIYVGAAHNTYERQRDSGCEVPSENDLTFESHYQSLLDPPMATFTAYKLNQTGPNVVSVPAFQACK